MEYKELLAAFAAKHGIDNLDGEDGEAALDVDGIRVELLDDMQTHSMLACAEIGNPRPDADGSFCTMLLQANFMLQATEGATICQNPETGAYAIVRPFPLDLTDADTLGSGLESLVNQTENWRNALAGLREAEDARSADTAQGDSHHDMISNGFVHV